MTLETFLEKFDIFADGPYAGAKMRELVLQLAMRGRLFSNHPTDLSHRSHPTDQSAAPFPSAHFAHP